LKFTVPCPFEWVATATSESAAADVISFFMFVFGLELQYWQVFVVIAR